MRIFLLGYMGVGKSYLGRELADRLGFGFVDLDSLVEVRIGLPISGIFHQFGEPFFRQIEAECLRSLSDKQKIVVATGGGTPCFHQNMEWMNETGVTVYFYATAQLLEERLQSQKAFRPLLANLPDDSLKFFIETKLAERVPFYEQCHLQFSVPQTGLEGIDALANYLMRFFPKER